MPQTDDGSIVKRTSCCSNILLFVDFAWSTDINQPRHLSTYKFFTRKGHIHLLVRAQRSMKEVIRLKKGRRPSELVGHDSFAGNQSSQRNLGVVSSWRGIFKTCATFRGEKSSCHCTAAKVSAVFTYMYPARATHCRCYSSTRSQRAKCTPLSVREKSDKYTRKTCARTTSETERERGEGAATAVLWD